MRIFSIFKSISGELGLFYPGSPTIFVRFAGCPLSCSWCFGVVPGRRIPRIITSRSPNKKLPDVHVGDDLMTFDSEMNLVETKVIEIHSRQVDSWIQILIAGTIYYVTEEHPFFTARGQIPAKELLVGDWILHSSFREKISFHKKLLNPMKDPYSVKKMVQSMDRVAMGLTQREIIRRKNALHKRGYSFWKNGNRKDGKRLSLESEVRMLNANGLEVQGIKRIARSDFPPSIRPKPVNVYNLTCAPHNSYLVDYMWVHNCDTSIAIPKDSGQEMSVEEVLQKVDELSHGRVIQQVLITGGEPLWQRPAFESLVRALKRRNYKIQVETSGVCFPSSGMLVEVDWWVVDYKLPSSGEESKMRLEEFYNFGERSSIKFPCKDRADLDYIEKLANPPISQILLSPVAPLTARELLEWQERVCLSHPWLQRAMLNVQLHKLVGLVEDQGDPNVV